MSKKYQVTEHLSFEDENSNVLGDLLFDARLNKESGESHSSTVKLSRSKEEYSKARELWIEQNCECGISEKTGKWSEKVFESFGCNCETEASK